MKHIVIASHNPVKAKAALAAFRRSFPEETFSIEAIGVGSGVSDQPMSDEETLLGARNRASGAREQRPKADFWVGIEGGIQDQGLEMTAFAFMVVLSVDGEGNSRSAAFSLPHPVAEWVRQGKELGEADDLVFGRTDSKKEEGAVGLLTGNVIDRAALYEHAMVLALIPFRHPAWYQGSSQAPSDTV